MSGTYKEITGDVTLIENPRNTVVLPHVCNNIGLFGAGVAGSIANRWPHVREKYLMWCKAFEGKNDLLLGMTQFVYAGVCENAVNVEKIFVANMFAMNGVRSATNRKPLVMSQLKLCMADLVYTAKHKFDTNFEIHCPKFGTVLAGGSWKQIRPVINALWIDSGINVTVYNFGG